MTSVKMYECDGVLHDTTSPPRNPILKGCVNHPDKAYVQTPNTMFIMNPIAIPIWMRFLWCDENELIPNLECIIDLRQRGPFDDVMIWALFPKYSTFTLMEEKERKNREEKAQNNPTQDHVRPLRGSLRKRGRSYTIHRINPLFF
jgi:hypothetical protein